jgi:hypothetical protein
LKILQLDLKDATLKNVNKNFRKLSLKYHSDKGATSDEMFTSLSNAREYLLFVFNKDDGQFITRMKTQPPQSQVKKPQSQVKKPQSQVKKPQPKAKPQPSRKILDIAEACSRVFDADYDGHACRKDYQIAKCKKYPRIFRWLCKYYPPTMTEQEKIEWAQKWLAQHPNTPYG